METKSNKRVSPVGGTCRIFARSVRDAAANKNIKVPYTDSSSSKSNQNSPLNDGDMKKLHAVEKHPLVTKVPRALFCQNDAIGILNIEKPENEVTAQKKKDQALKDILNDQSKSDFAKTEKNDKFSESRKQYYRYSVNSYYSSSSRGWSRRQIHENIENSKPTGQRTSRRRQQTKTNQKDVNRITDCRREYRERGKKMLGRDLSSETQVEDWNSELIDINVSELTAFHNSPSKVILKHDDTNIENTTNVDQNHPEVWIKELIVDTVCNIKQENNDSDIITNDISFKPFVKQASLQQSLKIDSDVKVSNDSMNENTSISCVEVTDSDSIVYLQEGELSGMCTRRPVFSRGGIKPSGVTRGESAKNKGCLNSIEVQNKSALTASQFMENFRKLQEQNKNSTEELYKNPPSVSVKSSKCCLEGNMHTKFSQDYRKSQLYKPTEGRKNENNTQNLDGKRVVPICAREKEKVCHNDKSIDEEVKKIDPRHGFQRLEFHKKSQNDLHLNTYRAEKLKEDEQENFESENWTEELLDISYIGNQELMSPKRESDNKNTKLLPDCKEVLKTTKQNISLLHSESKQDKFSKSWDTTQTGNMGKTSSTPSKHNTSSNSVPMKKRIPCIGNYSDVAEIKKSKCGNGYKGSGELEVRQDKINTMPNKEEYKRCNATNSKPEVQSLRDIINDDEKLSNCSQESPSRSKSIQHTERKSTKPAGHSDPSVYHNYSRQPPPHPSTIYPNTNWMPNWMRYYPYGYMYPPYYPYDYDPKYMTNNTCDRWSAEEEAPKFNQENERKKSKTKDSTGKRTVKTCVEEISKNSQMTRETVKKNLCHLITIPLREIQDEQQVKNLLEYVQNVLKEIANATGCYYQADAHGYIPVLHVGATLKEKQHTTDDNKLNNVDNKKKSFHSTRKNEMLESELSQISSDQFSKETPHGLSSPAYGISMKGKNNIHGIPHEFHPHFPTPHVMQHPFSMPPVGFPFHHQYYNSGDGFNMDCKGQLRRSVIAESKNMSGVKSPNSSIVSYDITDEEDSCDEEAQSTKGTSHDLEQEVIASSEHNEKPRIAKDFSKSSQGSKRQSAGYEENFPELSRTNQTVPSSLYQYGLEYDKRKASGSEHGKLSENKTSPVLTEESEKEHNKNGDSPSTPYVPPHKRKFSEDKPYSNLAQLNDLYCWQNWENNAHSNRNHSGGQNSTSTYNRYQLFRTNECTQKNGKRYRFPEEDSVSYTNQNNTFFYGGYGKQKGRVLESQTNFSSSYLSFIGQDSRQDDQVFSSRNKVIKESSYIWKKYLHQRCSTYNTKFIDTHCHLDFLFNRLEYRGSFKKFKEINSDCFPSNFEGCISIFCDPRTFDVGGLWKDLAEEDEVWLAMGCHPKHAKEFDQFAEDHMKKIITHPKVIAIGEIGLDYSTFHGKYEALQKTVFRRQLKLGLEAKKPIIIHCRDADDDCLEIMEEMVPRNHKIHCHCFTGNYMQAERWLNMFPNLYLGLTPLVTYTSATASHDFARNVPLSRLILETDAPYFIPRNLRKEEQKFSFPGFAVVVAEEVARLKDISVESVLAASRQNTKTLFSI